jgi:hypothetical protein
MTQTKNDMHGMYSVISGLLVKKYRIPIIQLKNHRKFKKKEGPNEDASIPFLLPLRFLLPSASSDYRDNLS